MQKRMLEVGGAPCALCARDNAEAAASRGTVLLLHGLGGEKEDGLEDLERLARAGFLALALDAFGHGERRFEAFEARLMEGSPEEQEAAFLEAVERTSREIPGVLDELEAQGWLPGSRVGLVGVSMGGTIALTARVLDDRVAAVVSISGSPRWERPRPLSPEENPERFFPAAVLLQHGERDSIVPPGPGRDFIEKLEPLYAKSPERLEYISYPEVGHLFRPEEWERVLDHTLRWCERFVLEESAVGRAG